MDSDDATFETWQIRVRGRVQGVGFRDGCARHAQQLGLAGWVRNRLDGSVELLLQGDVARLAPLRDWLPHGVRAARVDAIDVQVLAPPQPRLAGFERRATA